MSYGKWNLNFLNPDGEIAKYARVQPQHDEKDCRCSDDSLFPNGRAKFNRSNQLQLQQFLQVVISVPIFHLYDDNFDYNPRDFKS